MSPPLSFFLAGYSADSDYHSDVNFPVNCVNPNAATSQYLQVDPAAAAAAAMAPGTQPPSPYTAQQQYVVDPGGGAAAGQQPQPGVDPYNQQQQQSV